MPQTEKNIITVELDHNNLPPLTESQKAEIEALRRMPDSEIDYSDIPDKPWSTVGYRHGRMTRAEILQARREARNIASGYCATATMTK